MSNIFENKGALAATIVVVASNSLNQAGANYVCDGVNDQVEIQAAIDACVLSGGGLVYLSEGTYSITAPIIIKNQVSLAGAGWVTRLDLAANCNMFEADPAATAGWLTIRDMMMFGGAGAFSGDCFHIPAGQSYGDWYYMRLLITHFTGNGIYIETGWHHHVLDCVIEQIRGNGTACFYAKPTGAGSGENVRRITISNSNLFARAAAEAVAVNAIRWEGELNAIEVFHLIVTNSQLISRGAPAVYLRSINGFNITGCADIEELIGGGGYDGIFITDDGVTASRKGTISDNLFGNRYSLRYGISIWGLSREIAIGVNQYNLITNQKVYFDAGVTNVDGFRQQTTNIFMDVLGITANHVVNAQTLAADPTVCAIAAQPDVPRTLSYTITHPTLTAFTLTFVGVNAKGQTVTEVFTQATGWTGETSNAFATVTSITMSAMTGNTVADTIDVGITDVLGLSNVIYETGDVYKIKKNNANAVVAGAQVDVDYDTYDMAVIGLVAGDDFTIWFKSNLNVVA